MIPLTKQTIFLMCQKVVDICEELYVFASHTAINLGSEVHQNILFMGKSPKKIGSLIKKNNPYEQILKTSALSVGASCFNGDADTWVNGTFTN